MNDKNDVLGPTFEPGKSQGAEEGKWQQKLQTREEMIKYLQSSGISDSGTVAKHRAAFK